MHVNPYQVSQSVAPGVAQAFKHDLQYMLAEKTATTERGSNFKVWIRKSRGEIRSRALVDPCERAQIDSHRIILSGDAGLQIRDFQERVLRAIPVQESAAGLEPQINSGQGLDVTVMQ